MQSDPPFGRFRKIDAPFRHAPCQWPRAPTLGHHRPESFIHESMHMMPHLRYPFVSPPVDFAGDRERCAAAAA